ncbi:MAG TPA: acetoin utilization protein AcuC [Gammaproteobacteria bacterium]
MSGIDPIRPTAVYAGSGTAAYGFTGGHPFGQDRQDVFLDALREQGLDARVLVLDAKPARETDLLLFHDPYYVEFVRDRCAREGGYLDMGDTPAQAHIFDAGLAVVGATLTAAEAVMERRLARAFVPIGGLHHAARDRAAGFCVFSDIGVAVEMLRQQHGVKRIAYVDIDAHHGDGVFYAYEDDPDIFIADIHQDGRTLYPGTGHANETGKGEAIGTKLNLPLPAGAGSDDFRKAWNDVEAFLDSAQPEFVILQCGADSLANDPLTALELTAGDHGFAAARLVALAEKHAGGRLLALGGGGYNRPNLAAAWTAVVGALL